MTALLSGLKLGTLLSFSPRMLPYFASATLIVALVMGAIGYLIVPQPPGWAAWHAIEARYDELANTVVITGRSWDMYEPCPEETPYSRTAQVVDTQRVPRLFETDTHLHNSIGRFITGEPIVIPLVDTDGVALGIEPYSVRLIVTCGSRTPLASPIFRFPQTVYGGPR